MTVVDRTDEEYWAPGLFSALCEAPLVLVGRLEEVAKTDLDPAEMGLVAQRATEVLGVLHAEEFLRGVEVADAKWSFPYRSIRLSGGAVVPDGNSYHGESWNRFVPRDGMRVVILAESIHEDGTLQLWTSNVARAYGIQEIGPTDQDQIAASFRRFLELQPLSDDHQAREFADILADPEQPRLLQRLVVIALLDQGVAKHWSATERAGVVARFLVDQTGPIAFRDDVLSRCAQFVLADSSLDTEIFPCLVDVWSDEGDFNRLRLHALGIVSENLDRIRADPTLLRRLMQSLLQPASGPPRGMSNTDQVMIVDYQRFWVAPLSNNRALEALRMQVLEQLTR